MLCCVCLVFEYLAKRLAGKNISEITYFVLVGMSNLGMCSIRKCPTIIYCLKNTGIPRHFTISSIVDNFCKNAIVQIDCSAVADSVSHNCVLMVLYVDFLLLDVVVVLLAFLLGF